MLVAAREVLRAIREAIGPFKGRDNENPGMYFDIFVPTCMSKAGA